MPDLDVRAAAIESAFVPTFDHYSEVHEIAKRVKKKLDAIVSARRDLAERIADHLVAVDAVVDPDDIEHYRALHGAEVETARRLHVVLEEAERAHAAMEAQIR